MIRYLLEKHKEDVKAADSFAEALAKFLDTFWINQPDNKQGPFHCPSPSSYSKLECIMTQ